RIVAESFEEGANISEVARRNGVARGLLTVWRRQIATAVTGKGRADPNWSRERWRDIWRVRAYFVGTDQGFGACRDVGHGRWGGRDGGGGARTLVEPGVERAALATVLSALRGIR